MLSFKSAEITASLTKPKLIELDVMPGGRLESFQRLRTRRLVSRQGRRVTGSVPVQRSVQVPRRLRRNGPGAQR